MGEGKCVFCGHPETTNEHVFPQWLREVIPRKGTVPGGKITHTWEAPPGSTSESRAWEANKLTFQAKIVCQRMCNGGWMNNLENTARPFLEPMIQGRGRTLYDAGREQIAYWALKTSLTADYAQEEEHRSVPAADYPALYAAQGVLPNTFVWLAACDFGPGATARHRTLHMNVGNRHFDGFGFTFHVGHLVIEVTRVEVEQGKTIEIGGQLAPALRRIWPENQPVVWPPNAMLTRQQATLLGDMIQVSPIALPFR